VSDTAPFADINRHSEANKQQPENVIELYRADIYQKNTLILSDVNLSICKGEFVYLVGRTGTGKTSLLRTLYADLPLRKGECHIAGFDLRVVNWRTVPYLRRKMGIIFQDFQLLTDRSVADNLRFVLEATDWRDEKEILKRIAHVLHLVGISHKANAMPYALSGGEQQRVVIARALLNDPAIIIADEPTGNLDHQTSRDIIALLRQICLDTQTTVLLGTHDIYAMQQFPARTITCINGKIEEGDKTSA
jgi:cell division transport system ATP-binding protein